MTAHFLQGWIPVRLYRHDARLLVEWCYLGQRRLSEPFFGQTIDVCLRLPFNRIFRQHTPIDTLTALHEQRPGLPPHGFVFHMSRCGSTLIAQLLAALPSTVVLAEAGPLDALLRACADDPALPAEQRCCWLRSMVSALGQPRLGHETALLIKFDSWNVLDLPLIHQAFPRVPWIFVFRDPVEVLVSHQQEPGSHMVPSIVEPRVLGLPPFAAPQLSLDEYGTQVIARICSAALEYQALGKARFVHYPQLPELVWSALLDFFQLQYTQADLAALQQTALFHAKRRTEPFRSDVAVKQHAASERLRRLAAAQLDGLYQQLLALLPVHGGAV